MHTTTRDSVVWLAAVDGFNRNRTVNATAAFHVSSTSPAYAEYDFPTCSPPHLSPTFGLAVFAQERGVAENAVNAAFEMGRKLQGLCKVVEHKLGKDGEPVIVFEKNDLGARLPQLRFTRPL